MSCDRIRPQLTAYLDGELTDDRGSVVRGHLRGCEACRAAASDEAALRDGLRALPSVDPAPSLWAGIQQRLAAEEMADARRPAWRLALARWMPSVRHMAVGGLVAAAAVALLVVRSRQGAEPRDDETDRVASTTQIPPVVIAPQGSDTPASDRVPAVAGAEDSPADDDDVSVALASASARVSADYETAARELETIAAAARARWSAEQQQTFDTQLAALRKAIASANTERARQRQYRALVRYLQRAAIRDEVVASVEHGGTR